MANTEATPTEGEAERLPASTPPARLQDLNGAYVPRATYRIQLTEAFPFPQAQRQLAYLSELGISDVYTSPMLQARPGSQHGYDVVDHGQVNQQLGGDRAFERFARAARQAGLGIVTDLVPNHMCVDGNDNRWWLDVLEHGPSSPYASHFDIDWRPPKPDLADQVLLPVLGEQYGRVLENQLTVQLVDGRFRAALSYAWFPLAPRSWTHILAIALERLRAEADPEATIVLELESIIRALEHLPLRTETEPDRVRERRRETTIIYRRMANLTVDPTARGAMEAALLVVNGTRGEPRSFDTLERILAEQAYRLSFWRVAADEINYRRFFDINELAAIRVELPEVFEAVHRLALRHAAAGWLTGLRIDHVDGLFDPQKYLQDLQSAWKAVTGRPAYVVVEKILGPDETLPNTWPVAGTTGYDYLNLALSICIDPSSQRAMEALARTVAEGPDRFSDVVRESKRLVVDTAMSSQLTVLARRLDRISEQHRYSRDFTLNSLQVALAQVITGFSVYRTYVQPGEDCPSPRDQAAIEQAIHFAKRHNPAMSGDIFDFIRDVLLLRDPDGLSHDELAERRDFVFRLQQVTGPVMAKGLEDTAFYRYFPLAAHNEVGGEPHRFGSSPEAFHRAQQRRLEETPHTLNATATHDTKRGEDTRLRIAVLSEMPGAWRRTVERWYALNERFASALPGGRAPSRHEEYLFYQTLVGTWPIGGLPSAPDYVARISGYMEKALKEAKQHTSWISPNEAHDQAVKAFVAAALDPARNADFLTDLERFVRKPQWAGYWNGLVQTLLKVTSPGVPDIYQGTEFWDLSLVDPDNRRLVDYGQRRRALASLNKRFEASPTQAVVRLVRRPHDGHVKLWVLHRALALRKRLPQVFTRGLYVPLAVSGARADQVIAFARVVEGKAVLTVVGRFWTRFGANLRQPLGSAWGDTALTFPANGLPRRWRNALTNETLTVSSEGTLPLSKVLASLPVALLESDGDTQNIREEAR